MIAALYVESGGAYYGLEGVDPWDELRDARQYPGPFPVVAHPPCARWSILGSCRGYRDGLDGGCFESALAAVRTYGGVLEHPARSLAWERFALPRPGAYGWSAALGDPGWSCFVDQHHYGFPTRKPTWLYFVGDVPPPMLWGRSASKVSAQRMAGGGSRQALRSRTPPAFRDALLELARTANHSAPSDLCFT